MFSKWLTSKKINELNVILAESNLSINEGADVHAQLDQIIKLINGIEEYSQTPYPERKFYLWVHERANQIKGIIQDIKLATGGERLSRSDAAKARWADPELQKRHKAGMEAWRQRRRLAY